MFDVIEALVRMKAGKKVRRSVWQKDVFVHFNQFKKIVNQLGIGYDLIYTPSDNNWEEYIDPYVNFSHIHYGGRFKCGDETYTRLQVSEKLVGSNIYGIAFNKHNIAFVFDLSTKVLPL